MIGLLTGCPISAGDPWTFVRVTIGFLVTPLNEALLIWLLSLPGWSTLESWCFRTSFISQLLRPLWPGSTQSFRNGFLACVSMRSTESSLDFVTCYFSSLRLVWIVGHYIHVPFQSMVFTQLILGLADAFFLCYFHLGTKIIFCSEINSQWVKRQEWSLSVPRVMGYSNFWYLISWRLSLTVTVSTRKALKQPLTAGSGCTLT